MGNVLEISIPGAADATFGLGAFLMIALVVALIALIALAAIKYVKSRDGLASRTNSGRAEANREDNRSDSSDGLGSL